MLFTKLLDQDESVRFPLRFEHLTARSALEKRDSHLDAEPVSQTENKLARFSGGLRFGIQDGQQVVLRQFQINIVHPGFNRNLENFRPRRPGVQLIRLHRLSRRQLGLPRKLGDSLHIRCHRRVSVPEEHGQPVLLLFERARGADQNLPPTLNFLVRLDHIQWRHGAGLRSLLDLFQPVFRHLQGPPLDVRQLPGGDPFPVLPGSSQKQILASLRDLDVGPRVSQAGPLQFGILRVHHEAPEQGHREAHDRLIRAINCQVRDLDGADADTKAADRPDP